MRLGPAVKGKKLQVLLDFSKSGLRANSQILLERATFNQILHLRGCSCFEALFSELFCYLCRGFIALENKTFIIEPVSGHDTGAHFIYRVEELRLTPGACGHDFNTSSVVPESHIKSPFQSFHARVRLVLYIFLFVCFSHKAYNRTRLS